METSFALSALQLHSPLESLGTAGNFGSLGSELVNRRSYFPDGPPDVLEGRAFLHRVASAELIDSYFRGPIDFDNLTGETWEMRLAYRRLLLKEPAVKAALISKVQAVAALDPQLQPDDPDRPLDKAAAKFVDWSIQRSYGGWPRLIENILLPSLIDGFSICEKGIKVTRSQKYGAFWTLEKLYSLDTRHIKFDIDRFKNITKIRLTRTLPATALDPRDFVIFQHLQLFESPFGISDLRAAYRAAKLIESAIKLRGILLENFSGPFLKGLYPAGSQDIKANMEAVLAKARSLGWVVAPVGSEIEVINLATSAPDQFQSCIDDLRKEIYTAIRGAYLPFTEAGSGVQRADTGVQKSITEIFEWWLAGAVCEVINRQVIPDLVEWNYGDTAGLPRCQLGGMNLERASKQLDMIERVHKMTGEASKKQIFDLTRVEQATDDDDRLPPDGQGQGAMPGGPPGMPPAGPPISPNSANPQPPGMGPEQPAQQFRDASDDEHPVKFIGSRAAYQPAPAGWPPAGELEGRKLAAILQPSIDATSKLIVNATKNGLNQSIPNYASNGIWTPDDRRAVMESLAVLLSIGDMLARARLRQHQPDAEVRKFADAGASAAFDLFGHSGDTPFSFIDRPIRPPSHVELAIEYISKLVPIPGVDALFMADGWRRRAFTLALDTEGVILDKVKNAVVGELLEGDNATAIIQHILDEAGLSPQNSQYAEMVCRTNVMDAYNTGFHESMQDADVQGDFPVWQYCGIADGRQGDDHNPQFNKYFPAAYDFASVRGPRVYNCRCMPRPIYKTKWAKLAASGAEISDAPEWADGATKFMDVGASALTPTNRLGSLLCVAADLADEIRPERLRVVLGYLADNTAAYAAAIGVPPPPSRIFHGVYDESKHPRDDHGQWVDKTDIASARVNSGKAAELRSKVTKPAERAKLDAALGSNDPIATPPSKAAGKKLIAKARLGAATPQEQRDLFHHLPAISHEDLRDVREAVESQPSQQTSGAIEQRGLLADHVRAAAAGDPSAAMPEHPVFAAVKSEAAKSDLPASKKTQYAKRMDHVLRTMPQAAHDRISANLQGIGFHADNQAVGSAAVGSALERDFLSDHERQRITNFSEAVKKGKLKPAAAYLPKSGKLHVNGGDDSTYAHILGHAIDGPSKSISSSPAWERAWNAEIAGKLSEDPKLNRYAQGNPHEGFAEFARLVYGTEHSAADIEAKFPLAAAVLKTHGLWDDTPRFHQAQSHQAAPDETDGNGNNKAGNADSGTHQAQAAPDEIDRQGYDKNGVRGGEGRKLPSTASWAEDPSEVKLPDAFAERVALDSDAGGAHIDTLAPTHSPATGTPANPENQHVYTVPTKSLHVDPTLFQYKVAGIGADGVTNKLSKVTKWDHNLGGVSLVWRDPKSGKDYIVNGHHRKELADRVGQDTLNVRYINAKDSVHARSIGALANMAEGNGKAVDAAKWMRDTKQGVAELKAAGVPVTGKLVTDAAALVNLGPKAFDAVTQGRLEEDTAVAVAKHLKDPELQDALFAKIRARESAGNDWTPRQIETAAKKLGSAGKAATAGGGDLFGDIEGEQSTFDQEVDLEDFATRKLAQQITDFNAVGNRERAGRVADAGNTLNLQENAKRRKEAGDLQENFEKFARFKSNTSATVREYAAKLAAIGEHGSYAKKNDVRSEFYDKLKQAIGDDLAGKPAPESPADSGGVRGDHEGKPDAAATGGDGAPAGADSAAGGVPAPAGEAGAGEVTPSTEPDNGEEARQAGISALLGAQGSADAPAGEESAEGATGVLGSVGAEPGTTAGGGDGDQPGSGAAPDGGLAGPGQAPASEPIKSHLHGDDAAIDVATQERARDHYPELREKYLQKGMGTLDDNGSLKNVTLNTDEWREVFPEYKGTNAHAVHEASSTLNKKLFADALKETAGKGNNKMLILAGGGGSGKGTAVGDHIQLADYPLTLDQVSDNYKKLAAKMDEAREAGFTPQFVFIDRHPADAWTHGVVKRAASSRAKGAIARTVPLEVALHANIEARKVALQLLEQNADADATVIDNNHGFGKARLIEDRAQAIDFLKSQIAEHQYDELHGRLQRDTLDLHESGGLPTDIAEGLVGREAIHARRAQPGQSEGERAGGTDGSGAEGAAAGTGTEGDGTAGAVQGTAGPSEGEDLAGTSDKKLRRHGGDEPTDWETQRQNDAEAQGYDSPEEMDAALYDDAFGIDSETGKYKSEAGGETKEAESETAGKEPEIKLARKVGRRGEYQVEFKDGKHLQVVKASNPEEARTEALKRRASDEKNDNRRSEELGKMEPFGGPKPDGGFVDYDKPEPVDLGGGYKPVGKSDWHKNEKTGELVHAPTVKKTRKPRTASGETIVITNPDGSYYRATAADIDKRLTEIGRTMSVMDDTPGSDRGGKAYRYLMEEGKILREAKENILNRKATPDEKPNPASLPQADAEGTPPAKPEAEQAQNQGILQANGPDAAPAGDSAGAANLPSAVADGNAGENDATMPGDGAPSPTVSDDGNTRSTDDKLAEGSGGSPGTGVSTWERLGAGTSQASSQELPVPDAVTRAGGNPDGLLSSADLPSNEPTGDVGGSGSAPADGSGAGDGRTPADNARRRKSPRRMGNGRRGGGLDGSGPAIPEPSPVEASVAEDPAPHNPTDVSAGNFRYDTRDFFEKGLKAKFNANITAIRTLRAMEAEGRNEATPEEQSILSKFVGWGQFPALFSEMSNRTARSWDKEREVLQGLLSREDYDSAKRSILNAHYTHPSVVDAHWKLAEHLGYKGGRFLETSAGVGYYLGMMPKNLSAATHSTAIELDKTSGGMLSKLYPKANVQVKGFQDHNISDNFYDLVASNVPFGDYGVHDKRYNKHDAAIHDYFFLKSLDKVRPGGLIMHITSAGTLDKGDSSIREELHRNGAELVGAIRFPSGAHKENAGTDVVTDMLILRKRLPDELPGDNSWTKTTMIPDPEGGEPIPVNQYFANNPHMVLGRVDRSGTMYHGASVSVTAPGGEVIREIKQKMKQEGRDHFTDEEEERIAAATEAGKPDYEKRLEAAIASMPKNVMTSNRPKRKNEPMRMPAPGDVKAGGYAHKDGKLFIEQSGELVEHKVDKDTNEKIAAHLAVRDAMRAVVNDQTSGKDSSASRAELNRVYNDFVDKHGFLNDKANRRAFRTDPDAPRLLALEKWNAETGKAEKDAMFHKDTIRAASPVESAANVHEGLGVSLHENGKVDIDHIARLTKSTPEKVEHELVSTGKAFNDPSHGWQPASQYLSGNVRRKLTEARAAAAADPKLRPNVEALEKVQPKDVDHEDIDVKLGAHWVPTTDIADFAAHLLGADREHFAIAHNAIAGDWHAEYSRQGSRYSRTDQATKIWGTDHMNMIHLLKHALNSTTPIIRGPKDENGSQPVDVEATQDAQAKLQEIKEEYKNWIWSGDERRDRLHRHYNDNFNNTVRMKYDGSHLKFPGMDPNYKPHAHIPDFVWQVVTTGSGMAAHEVGMGKTTAMVAAAMELRRLGLAKKPSIACLKSNIEQLTHEATKIYPGIKILSTADMFDGDNRRLALSKIASGDYDLVVMTHDHLDKMKMKPEVEAGFIRREMQELEDAIMESKKDDPSKGNRVVKDLEKQKLNLETRLKDALDDTRKDDTLYFEETGIDHLFVDEAHHYKTLPCYTKMRGLKGVPTGRSDRATNMHMRTQWLQENNGGRGVTFLTGTPVKNTMAELYVMQLFLQPNILKERGIHNFDAWANLFGDTETKTEFSIGGEYQPVTRFSRFTNLNELTQMTAQDIDYQRIDNLKDPVTGKPTITRPKKNTHEEIAPKTPLISRMMDDIKSRAQEIKARKGPSQKGEDNFLKLCTEGSAGAVDARLYFPDAEDHPDSKTNRMIANVLKISNENPGKTQMIFSDTGVNPTETGFHLYKDIIDKLVAGGIPREKIADFSKLENDKKEAAAQAIRRGTVLIGIGSTKKLGTGVNAQDKLLAVHHLDVPWTPADIEQRNGRAWRHGNENTDGIHVHHYLAEGTIDQTRYGIVSRKAKFIGKVLEANDPTMRHVDDEDAETVDYDRMMASASGNPLIVEHIDVARAVKDLRAAKDRHSRDQYRLKDGIKKNEHKIEAVEDAIETTKRDAAKLDENPDFSLTVGGTEFTKESHGDKVREAANEALVKKIESTLDPYVRGQYIGEYRGLPIYKIGNKTAIKASGDIAGNSSWPETHYYTGDNLQSIEAVARGIKNRAKEHEDTIQRTKADIERVKQDIGKPFAKADKLRDQEQRFNSLEKMLRGTAFPEGYKHGDEFTLHDGRYVKLVDAHEAHDRAIVEHDGVRTDVHFDDFPDRTAKKEEKPEGDTLEHMQDERNR